MEFSRGNKTFDAAGYLVCSADGLTRGQMNRVMERLPHGEELLPFSATLSEYSSIIGFVTKSSLVRTFNVQEDDMIPNIGEYVLKLTNFLEDVCDNGLPCEHMMENELSIYIDTIDSDVCTGREAENYLGHIVTPCGTISANFIADVDGTVGFEICVQNKPVSSAKYDTENNRISLSPYLEPEPNPEDGASYWLIRDAGNGKKSAIPFGNITSMREYEDKFPGLKFLARTKTMYNPSI